MKPPNLKNALPNARLRDALDQFHRARRSAYLAFVDHIGEDVARGFVRFCRVDARQIVRLAAAGPQLESPRPGVELLGRIAGLDLVVTLLQPRIDEIAG